MILFVSIKNFKKYKNTCLIPVSYGYKFSAYLGPNGIGKTSIFEALNYFFNSTEWISNNSVSNKDEKEGGIAPLFLLPKNFFKLNDEEKEILELISSCFWDKKFNPLFEFDRPIYDCPDKLIELGFNRDKYYLILLGQTNSTSEIYIPYYQKLVSNELSDAGYQLDDLFAILPKIKDYYRFIYLPSEADSNLFTNLESVFVKKLIDEDIKNKIKSFIPRESILKINNDLSLFLNQINEFLNIYLYKGKTKNNLTANDLVERIFHAYFATKILYKANDKIQTPIKHLSSGEKKQALVDLAHALIRRSTNRSYQIIIAIDEPDASIHITSCYDLFEKISGIKDLCKPNPQVLINTHWYGFIPIMRFGNAHSISLNKDDEVSFYTLNLENTREQINLGKRNGNSPQEIELKSYQDMIQSVLMSMTSDNPYNWVFCEGSSDKIYLEHYLYDEVKNNNLRIVPVGGCKHVKKVYDHLIGPMSDRDINFNGKVVCLVDTDSQQKEIIANNNLTNLKFKRITLDTSNRTIKMIDVSSDLRHPIVIEDTLNPKPFEKLLSDKHINNKIFGADVLKDIMSNVKTVSSENNMHNYMDFNYSTRNRFFNEFLAISNNENKVKFAKLYVAHDPEKKHPPSWLQDLKKILI